MPEIFYDYGDEVEFRFLSSVGDYDDPEDGFLQSAVWQDILTMLNYYRASALEEMSRASVATDDGRAQIVRYQALVEAVDKMRELPTVIRDLLAQEQQEEKSNE